jgi:hypothetical protein
MYRNILSITAILLIGASFSTISACGRKDMNAPETIRLPSFSDVSREDWANLEQKRIFFGHQSVGYNVVDGIRGLAGKNGPVVLKILETTNPDEFSTPLFAHAAIGKNGDPLSKSTAFSDLLLGRLAGRVDIALVKFCYVDITGNSDLKKVMAGYEISAESLKREFPNLVIIHVTVPLNARSMGLRSSIKRLFGYPEWVDESNIKKNEFNRILTKRYEGKEPVFDLAAAESSYPDGRRSSFIRNGQIYYSLAPEYTDDGGHLNALGRKRIAEQFLITMANAAKVK